MMSYPPAYAFMNDVIKLWHDSALNPKFKTERKIIREIFYNHNENLGGYLEGKVT